MTAGDIHWMKALVRAPNYGSGWRRVGRLGRSHALSCRIGIALTYSTVPNNDGRTFQMDYLAYSAPLLVA